jgi:SAM-dependent methyltransferase
MKANDLPRSIEPTTAWNELVGAASAPYKPTSRWAYHWARGKLTRDPVFRGLLERGDFAHTGHVLDIGCGQGLVATLLQACAAQQRAGRWPVAWGAPPAATAYTGIELMAKDVARAEAALAPLPLAPRFVAADMCTAAFPPCDTVVILDVLHYVDRAAQDGVLERVRDALRHGQGAQAGHGSRLLLRVGDMADTKGFAASQWVDRVVTWARGHRVPPTFGRPLAQWQARLRELGFAQVRAVPQSQGTPFANVLLVAAL